MVMVRIYTVIDWLKRVQDCLRASVPAGRLLSYDLRAITAAWREIFCDAGSPGLVFLGDYLVDYILLLESSVSARLQMLIGNTSASYLHLDRLNHRHQGSTD